MRRGENKMNYEMIVLDLDGTLTNRNKEITPRTKEALMEAQKRGKIVVLAWSLWRESWSFHALAVIYCLSTAG